MKPRPQDLDDTRADIFTTLAIAALIHETDEAVRQCAKQLIKRAPRSICKNTLFPLSQSAVALDIVIDEVVYPTNEKLIGEASINGYTYDIYVIYRDSFYYEIKEMVDMITQKFIQRGLIKGWLKMSFRYFYRIGFFTHFVNMELSSTEQMALDSSAWLDTAEHAA